MSKATATRHYVTTNLETKRVKLVEASSPSMARNHVTRNLIDVRVANTKDMAAAFKDCTPIEVAGEEEVSS